LPARVLIVEDDPLAGELICEIVCSAGMDASFLTSSTEAAELLKREKYHAVFLDMRMPTPDGADLARQLRASRINASTVIVMISGDQDREVMRRAFEAGVEFFLFKPVDRNKLLRLIRVTEGSIERARRRFTRVRLRCRVSVESSNERLAGTTLDLSLSGALIQSPSVFPLGTVVKLSLEFAAGAAPLQFSARVVRTVGTDCMGIQFVNLEPKQSIRLQEYLLPLILAAT
jgi:DNA-binding response OmpR family regulator